MKKTIIVAGAASALLLGTVAIAQTGATTTPNQPGVSDTSPAGSTAAGSTTARDTTARDTTASDADRYGSDAAQRSGATTASEYGSDASGTAMDRAGERG